MNTLRLWFIVTISNDEIVIVFVLFVCFLNFYENMMFSLYLFVVTFYEREKYFSKSNRR